LQKIMKIAVNGTNDLIAPHFGGVPDFTVFEVAQGSIRRVTHLHPEGPEKEDVADLLVKSEIDLLICGTLPGEAEQRLVDAGIMFLRGCSGTPRSVVERYLAGTLPLEN